MKTDHVFTLLDYTQDTKYCKRFLRISSWQSETLWNHVLLGRYPIWLRLQQSTAKFIPKLAQLESLRRDS